MVLLRQQGGLKGGVVNLGLDDFAMYHSVFSLLSAAPLLPVQLLWSLLAAGEQCSNCDRPVFGLMPLSFGVFSLTGAHHELVYCSASGIWSQGKLELGTRTLSANL